MARIFICYRRDDTAGHAGRLYDRLQVRFGAEVFMDIEAIGPGADYADLIAETIDTVEAVIVIIGPQWLHSTAPDGGRRLDDTHDLVRREIAEALARKVLTIPILVHGATLPEPEELPAELAGLTRHNAFELSDARWNYDAERLIRALEEAFAGQASTATTDQTRPWVGSSPRGLHRPEIDAAGNAGGTGGRGIRAGGPPSIPFVLAVGGGLLVIAWGLVVVPQWHNEQLAIRIIAALLAVGGGAVGLRMGRWGWVMVSGAGAVAGFALWLLGLLPTHSIGELMSFQTDGVTNGLFLVGSAMVFAGGWLGSRRSSSRPSRGEPPKVRI